MFSGRDHYLKLFERLYHDDKADLVLVYGRRRVGKSRLVGEFLHKKTNVFHFIGVEPLEEREETTFKSSVQMQNFLNSLAEQTNKPLLSKLKLSQWEECLSLLTAELPKKDVSCCVFFDELPWMACQRLDLIRALFKFWETDWSHRAKFMLIVCGSSVGFLEKHFIKSSLFYGRATQHVHLHPLTLKEVKQFFGHSRDNDEIINLYMHFGGVPRYLELVSSKESVRKAVSHLCFSRDSFFSGEIATLFRSSFIRESPKYFSVVRALSRHRHLDYAALAVKSKSARGSSFKFIIDNLFNADLISKTMPFDKLTNTNLVEYYLSDEFLSFYLQFMQPHQDLIKSHATKTDLYDLILPERKLFGWKGRTFEKVMLKHATDIAAALRLEKIVTHHGCFYSGDDKKSCQIDLVFLRTDKTITACEIKYSENQIGMTKELDLQLRRQRDWLKRRYPKRRIETALVTNAAVSDEVRESDLVSDVVTMSDLL